MFETPCSIPRHAFSARDAARAGDVWRLFQEVAVDASTAAGWSPQRYVQQGTAFVVRSMVVRHDLEPHYGEALTGQTWVSRMRREMLSTREIRVRSARGSIAAARQEWAHVSAALEPTRGSRELLDAFPAEAGPEGQLAVELPPIATPLPEHAPHVFELRAWWTWMDPLDHANHPAYVDWADEATCVAMHRAGLAPVRLAPVAEEITFKSGVVGDERARVESMVKGLTADGAAVIAHRILVGDRLCANGTTVRRMLGEVGPTAIVDALRAPG